jgi:hypothetical protein
MISAMTANAKKITLPQLMMTPRINQDFPDPETITHILEHAISRKNNGKKGVDFLVRKNWEVKPKEETLLFYHTHPVVEHVEVHGQTMSFCFEGVCYRVIGGPAMRLMRIWINSASSAIDKGKKYKQPSSDLLLSAKFLLRSV